MLILNCTKVHVRFNKAHLQAQYISASEHSRAFFLSVHKKEDLLTVFYCDKDSVALKAISFNFSDVTEYSCEDIVSLTQNNSTSTPEAAPQNE